MDIERRLTVVLTIIAMCIFALILRERTEDAWWLMCIYWLIVTLKNAADAAGRD